MYGFHIIQFSLTLLYMQAHQRIHIHKLVHFGIHFMQTTNYSTMHSNVFEPQTYNLNYQYHLCHFDKEIRDNCPSSHAIPYFTSSCVQSSILASKIPPNVLLVLLDTRSLSSSSLYPYFHFIIQQPYRFNITISLPYPEKATGVHSKYSNVSKSSQNP